MTDTNENKEEKKHPLPTKKELLDFIHSQPGKIGKREIARAFGIKGGTRIALKRLLRELKSEGLLETKNRRTPLKPDHIEAQISGQTSDGELQAQTTHQVKDDDGDNSPTRTYIILEHSAHNRGKSRRLHAAIGDKVIIKPIENKNKADHHQDDYEKYAHLVKIIEKQPETLLCIISKIKDEAEAEPVDHKSKTLTLALKDLKGAEKDDLVRVAIRKEGKYGPTSGTVIDILGKATSEKAVSAIALIQHDIPHIFPHNVDQEAKAAKPAPMAEREDWCSLPFLTIDPHDAKDHDDAVYACPDKRLENEGGHHLYVAIADVAHYVIEGSAMDEEAIKRGNSVYFPDRVVPMLPERLSNDLCSLKQNQDRPALALKITFNAQGEKISHSFHHVMINVKANISYQEAQKAFDFFQNKLEKENLEALQKEYQNTLKQLWDAYQSLVIARNKRSPLNLNMPERKIILNRDNHIKRIIMPPRLEAHRLIEEAMVLSNVCAAQTLENEKPSALHRIHDAPSLMKLETLRQFLKSIEINLPKQGNFRPSHFNAILNKLSGTEYEIMANEIILRSQAQAEYNNDNIGHFGLNLSQYAHFTSPIRRYADLTIHRALLKKIIANPPKSTADNESQSKLATHLSMCERRAMAAERDTKDRLIAFWLQDQIGSEFNGIISGVTKSGLFVRLEDNGADGFIPMRTLTGDYYLFDEAHHRLIGKRTKSGYQMGDYVSVLLDQISPYAGAIRFEMLTPPRIFNRTIKEPDDEKSKNHNSRKKQPPKARAHKAPKKGKSRASRRILKKKSRK